MVTPNYDESVRDHIEKGLSEGEARNLYKKLHYQPTKCKCSECDCSVVFDIRIPIPDLKTISDPYFFVCWGCRNDLHEGVSYLDLKLKEKDEMTPKSGYNICIHDDLSGLGGELTFWKHVETKEEALEFKKELEKKLDKEYEKVYIFPFIEE